MISHKYNTMKGAIVHIKCFYFWFFNAVQKVLRLKEKYTYLRANKELDERINMALMPPN